MKIVELVNVLLTWPAITNSTIFKTTMINIAVRFPSSKKLEILEIPKDNSNKIFSKYKRKCKKSKRWSMISYVSGFYSSSSPYPSTGSLKKTLPTMISF